VDREGRQREVDGGEDSRPVRREHERRQCEVIRSDDSVTVVKSVEMDRRKVIVK
jgi:hypothetical protein